MQIAAELSSGRRRPRWGVLLLLTAVGLQIACGGSSSSGSGSSSSSSSGSAGTITPAAVTSNVVALKAGNPSVVNVSYANGLWATVTICAPGTSTCATIPDILVDTGSYGLRVLVNPTGATLTSTGAGLASLTSLGLSTIQYNSKNLAECVTFLDGSMVWGPVQRADVIMGSETTQTGVSSGLPVHLLGDPSVNSSFPAIPSACGTTSSADNTPAKLGANGILGIGPFILDCGTYCASSVPSPAMYYACTGTGSSATCTSSAVTPAVSLQVANPVAFFGTDSNGTIIQLNNVGASGASTGSGSLVFGIGTQSNNGIGSATVLPLNSSGYYSVQYGGTSYSNSFVDSGSNAFFFLNASKSGISECTGSLGGFYCPSSTTSFSATTVAGDNSTSKSVTFSISNSQTLFSGSNSAFSTLGGTSGSSSLYFDMGLSFFYGRYVYTGIANEGGYRVTSVSGLTGPFVAY